VSALLDEEQAVALFFFANCESSYWHQLAGLSSLSSVAEQITGPDISLEA